MFDPEATAKNQCLNAEDAKFFRFAFGICICVSQERYDIQHSMRALGTRMAEPTKTAMGTVKKLTSCLELQKCRSEVQCVHQEFTTFFGQSFGAVG